MMLIDVNSQSLVQVSQPKKYIALSYVWGQLPGVLETKKCNVSQLQDVGRTISLGRQALHRSRRYGAQGRAIKMDVVDIRKFLLHYHSR